MFPNLRVMIKIGIRQPILLIFSYFIKSLPFFLCFNAIISINLASMHCFSQVTSLFQKFGRIILAFGIVPTSNLRFVISLNLPIHAFIRYSYEAGQFIHLVSIQNLEVFILVPLYLQIIVISLLKVVESFLIFHSLTA